MVIIKLLYGHVLAWIDQDSEIPLKTYHLPREQAEALSALIASNGHPLSAEDISRHMSTARYHPEPKAAHYAISKLRTAGLGIPYIPHTGFLLTNHITRK